jgi:DNA processing protein
VGFDEKAHWFRLSLTKGLGPAGLQKIARELDRRRESVLLLADFSATEIAEVFGFKVDLANAIEQRMGEPIPLPDPMDGIDLAVPGDENFPYSRYLQASPAFSPVLWCGAERSLLNYSGSTMAIAGSRDAADSVLEQVYNLALEASRNKWLVVSGLARGVDSAGHEGAINGGTGTIGVLASGIANQSRSWMPDDFERICVISQFMPSEPWSGPRAMQRNSTIAGLSDRVVIAAAGDSGGSWAMGDLCLGLMKKKKKLLFVFDLPENVAAGNQKLIRSGAIPLDPNDPMATLLQAEVSSEPESEQLRLL